MRLPRHTVGRAPFSLATRASVSSHVVPRLSTRFYAVGAVAAQPPIALVQRGFLPPTYALRRNRSADQSSSMATRRTVSKPSDFNDSQPVSRLISLL